jgi:hypothetical protein
VFDFLPSYLDTIDERLLGYLVENDELRTETVQRLRFYTSALLDGSLSPAAVAEDWPDWFDLAPAFVVHRSRAVVGSISSSRSVAETGTSTFR